MKNQSYQYEDQVLKELQNVEKEVLRNFDKVCKSHNLKYFGVFGTALGAIRHKGFIPWDDDIDVGMMLEDYEKLMMVPECEWEQLGLELQSAFDNCSYHMFLYPCIYKKGTRFIGKAQVHSIRNSKMDLSCRPIFLDVFVFSHVSDFSVVNKYSKKLYRLSRYWRYSLIGMRTIPGDGFIFNAHCVINNALHGILSLFPNSDVFFRDKFWKTIKELNVGQYVTTFTADVSEASKLYMKESDIFPLVNVSFEDIQLPMPKNYDKMLRSLYGDYMKIPAVSERVNHAPRTLDFGNGDVISK